MNTNDPWSGILPPVKAENVTAQRVDENLKWDIYWAVDLKRNCLLILQHHMETKPTSKLPKFKGLQMDAQLMNDGHHRLILRLLDRDQREIFHRLCLDIISSVESAQTEEQVIQRYLNRTWRWHRLLKGARDNRLSLEEQRGLFGELVFLEKHLFPILDMTRAVESWMGPFGSPKDFVIGQIYVEVKTKRDSATHHVIISSELQLDSANPNMLFLQVGEVMKVYDHDPQAVTITQLASRIRSKISGTDISIVDHFENLLAATGFDWDEDYSDCIWLYGEEYLYKVEEGFPRVTPKMYPEGVENLRYSISLTSCEKFRVEKKELIQELYRNGYVTRN